jgi:hypothetical protein
MHWVRGDDFDNGIQVELQTKTQQQGGKSYD